MMWSGTDDATPFHKAVEQPANSGEWT